jgi:hypothetical protein
MVSVPFAYDILFPHVHSGERCLSFEPNRAFIRPKPEALSSRKNRR